MKLKTITTLLLALVVAFSATLAVVPTAEAACSYPGYYNSSGQCVTSYNYQLQNQNQNQNRVYYYNDQAIFALIEKLQEMIRLLESRLSNVSESTVSVSTRSAINIEDDSATLRGRIDLNREDMAKVYFEYGNSISNLDEMTNKRIVRDSNSTYSFEANIEDLDDNTVYYFRAIAGDDDGDENYGVILNFRTDRKSSSDDEPTLDTRSAGDIDENSAELYGSVNMNDFENGKVFFVYGESRSDIEDVADDFDRYSDIDEAGDDLRKVLLESSLDGSATYQETVTGLDSDSRIYYSICVEFEDEDNDDKIICGDVESLKTDR